MHLHISSEHRTHIYWQACRAVRKRGPRRTAAEVARKIGNAVVAVAIVLHGPVEFLSGRVECHVALCNHGAQSSDVALDREAKHPCVLALKNESLIRTRILRVEQFELAAECAVNMSHGTEGVIQRRTDAAGPNLNASGDALLTVQWLEYGYTRICKEAVHIREHIVARA